MQNLYNLVKQICTASQLIHLVTHWKGCSFQVGKHRIHLSSCASCLSRPTPCSRSVALSSSSGVARQGNTLWHLAKAATEQLKEHDKEPKLLFPDPTTRTSGANDSVRPQVQNTGLKRSLTDIQVSPALQVLCPHPKGPCLYCWHKRDLHVIDDVAYLVRSLERLHSWAPSFF